MSTSERAADALAAIDAVYRSESRRVLATLIRILDDFDLAEEALHDAVAAAVQRWPVEGIPAQPRAWLVSVARFKAVDAMRRRARHDGFVAASATTTRQFEMPVEIADVVSDDQLRLIFTCCHPALASDARVALTLREVCGLTTEEIARAFLLAPPTVAQRIVRAKAKIREAGIPFDVPRPSELPGRLDPVLQVIYLLFNEGYHAHSGDPASRADLAGEAIRLGRLLLELLPEPEVLGLLALMLLQESRRAARTDCNGDVVLLPDQDRTLWRRDLIDEGVALLEQALALRRFGPYTLQAAIAAVHAEADAADNTDWHQIVGIYDVLMRIDPSPVVRFNRAAAIAMRDGVAVGLRLMDDLVSDGSLRDYRFAHSSWAELCRRVGRTADARSGFERALALVRQDTERRFLLRRIEMVES